MCKRTVLALVLIGVIGFAFTAAASAADKPIRLAGKITKIDGKALTISVDGKETTITCNDATKFRRDGQSGASKFEDLQVGQSVRAYYLAADNTAQSVIIAKAAQEQQ